MRLRDGDAGQQVGEPRPFQTQVMRLASQVRKGMLTIHVQPLQLFFFIDYLAVTEGCLIQGRAFPPCPPMPGTQAGRARPRGLALWPEHVSMLLSRIWASLSQRPRGTTVSHLSFSFLLCRSTTGP